MIFLGHEAMMLVLELNSVIGLRLMKIAHWWGRRRSRSDFNGTGKGGRGGSARPSNPCS